MSGFLDKLKNGFAEAGNKAKIIVDVNRLKMQIAQEEREMKETFTMMGEKVFDHYLVNALDGAKEEMMEDCRKIVRIKEEIHQLELKVMELNDEKECPECKEVLAKEVRFCPECGYQFEDIVMYDEEKNTSSDGESDEVKDGESDEVKDGEKG